jgi:hypothetical protein
MKAIVDVGKRCLVKLVWMEKSTEVVVDIEGIESVEEVEAVDV